MGNDPAPFWANENEYVSELISNDETKAHNFHAAKLFIDDLGTFNDGDVLH